MKKKSLLILAMALLLQLVLSNGIFAQASFAQTAIQASGNLNMDVAIWADQNTIQSGQTGVFNLTFKATGSKTKINDGKIRVTLPEQAAFSQPLSELKIAGKIPVYNKDNKTLTYNFPTLETGQVYSAKVKVIPKNGTTPDGTVLKAKADFSATGISPVAGNASIKVNATAGVSLSKKYTSTDGKTANQAPVQGDTGVWTISADMPKKATGQLYLKEGSDITITDIIPEGTIYVSSNNGGVYSPSKRTVTWTFPAPSTAAQEIAVDQLFHTTVNVKLQFNDKLHDFTNITNTAQSSIVTVGGQTVTHSATAQRQIASESGGSPATTGVVVKPVHLLNGSGTIPVVYDWQTLNFASHYYIIQNYITDAGNVSASDVLSLGYKSITEEYSVDQKLTLKSISTRVPSYSTELLKFYALSPLPEAWIKVKTGGAWGSAHPVDYSKADYTPWGSLNLSLSELGIAPGTHVEALSITYKTDSGANFSGGFGTTCLNMNYGIEKGYTGPVTNSVKVYGTFGDGTDFRIKSDDPLDDMGPRTANVVAPSDAVPIVKNQIAFDEANGNEITVGNGKVTGTFSNTAGSQKRVNGPFEDMVLLPEGVTVDKTNSGAMFKNAAGDYSLDKGDLRIISNDYRQTGRQLVKITWAETDLSPAESLEFSFKVVISKNTPSPVDIDSYAYTGEPQVAVPADSSLTASVLESDTDDLNNNSNSGEYRVKTTSRYVLNQTSGLIVKKSVKGDLDRTYSNFGHVAPGGDISYKLNIKNIDTDLISNMTLMDVLPSVGDLGLTDNAERGSMFTPTLKGPVTLPDSWKDKVNLVYSTSKNPQRGDLDKNTTYSATTARLADPQGAETPDWLEEGAVSDWSKIHSFKIELKPGVTWVKGDNIDLQFHMQAPDDLSANLTLSSTGESGRAAWNSFAFAANHSQVVEPAAVGVVVNVNGTTPANPQPKPSSPNQPATPEHPGKAPQTGDEGNLPILVICLIGSLIGLTVAAGYKRKQP